MLKNDSTRATTTKTRSTTPGMARRQVVLNATIVAAAFTTAVVGEDVTVMGVARVFSAGMRTANTRVTYCMSARGGFSRLAEVTLVAVLAATGAFVLHIHQQQKQERLELKRGLARDRERVETKLRELRLKNYNGEVVTASQEPY
eukprot:jgi/Chlat1/6861/Chrsp51S00512